MRKSKNHMELNSTENNWKQDQLLRNLLLEKLVKGYNEPPESMKEMLALGQIRFNSNWFSVLLFQLPERLSIASEDSSLDFITSKKLEEAYSDLGQCFCWDMERQRLLLVNLNEDYINSMDNTKNQAERKLFSISSVIVEAGKDVGTEIRIYISNIHRGIKI